MSTVVPVPRGGHLPLPGSPALPPLRLTGGFCHADHTVPRQDVNSSFHLPACATPGQKGARTHAGSGPSRVRRRLFSACLGDPILLATLFCPWILDHGVSFIISILGAKILISYFLLDITFHHRFQSVLIRSYFLLMNRQVIQFQYGPLEIDPQILERWGYTDEVHLGKYIRAKDFGIEFWYDVQ